MPPAGSVVLLTDIRTKNILVYNKKQRFSIYWLHFYTIAMSELMKRDFVSIISWTLILVVRKQRFKFLPTIIFFLLSLKESSSFLKKLTDKAALFHCSLTSESEITRDIPDLEACSPPPPSPLHERLSVGFLLFKDFFLRGNVQVSEGSIEQVEICVFIHCPDRDKRHSRTRTETGANCYTVSKNTDQTSRKRTDNRDTQRRQAPRSLWECWKSLLRKI